MVVVSGAVVSGEVVVLSPISNAGWHALIPSTAIAARCGASFRLDLRLVMVSPETDRSDVDGGSLLTWLCLFIVHQFSQAPQGAPSRNRRLCFGVDQWPRKPKRLRLEPARFLTHRQKLFTLSRYARNLECCGLRSLLAARTIENC